MFAIQIKIDPERFKKSSQTSSSDRQETGDESTGPSTDPTKGEQTKRSRK